MAKKLLWLEVENKHHTIVLILHTISLSQDVLRVGNKVAESIVDVEGFYWDRNKEKS